MKKQSEIKEPDENLRGNETERTRLGLAASAPELSTNLEDQSERASAMNNFTILQVEDDENDVALMRHSFKVAEIPYPLQVARDGQEAVDYLSGTGKFSDRIQHPIPCLILLDLKMPRKTGFEVLEWLRRASNYSSLPVIIFSSSALRVDIERAYRLGANSFVVKPTTAAKRVQLVQAIRNYWLMLSEPPLDCIERPRGNPVMLPTVSGYHIAQQPSSPHICDAR
jgi:CheY-like chemotaxis protein